MRTGCFKEMAAYFTEWSWYCTCETLKRILDCFSVVGLPALRRYTWVWQRVHFESPTFFHGMVDDSKQTLLIVNEIPLFCLLKYFALFCSSDRVCLHYHFLIRNAMLDTGLYVFYFRVPYLISCLNVFDMVQKMK